jgi:hypothetical protein
MLAEHPEILAKLREEILRVVGPMQRPTYDAFRDMKYLRVRPHCSLDFEGTVSTDGDRMVLNGMYYVPYTSIIHPLL